MKRGQIKTQLDAIIYFLESLDADMIGTLLGDENVYCGVDKETFVKKLNEVFRAFSCAGNTRLVTFPGASKSIGSRRNSYSEKESLALGYSFVGDNSSHFLDLLFVEKEGRVHSIEDSRELYIDWPDHDEINRLVVNEQEMMLREYSEEDE
jgi:hypothetical protein